MFTVITPDAIVYDTAREVIAYVRKLDPLTFVRVEAPAGRFTGLDTIPYTGAAQDVLDDLEHRYH